MLKRLLILCLVLVLAVVANVGVAWGLVVCCQQRLPRDDILVADREGGWDVIDYWVVSSWSALGLRQIAYTPTSSDPPLLSGDDVEERRPSVPRWAPWPNRQPAQYSDEPTLIYVAAGWPLKCVSAKCFDYGRWPGAVRSKQKVNTPPAWTNAIAVRDRGGVAFRVQVLPYGPIWSGLGANVVFYAILLWLLFLGPVVLVRRLRLRRHRCPSCGYPVGVSEVCTECGGEVGGARSSE